MATSVRQAVYIFGDADTAFAPTSETESFSVAQNIAASKEVALDVDYTPTNPANALTIRCYYYNPVTIDTDWNTVANSEYSREASVATTAGVGTVTLQSYVITNAAKVVIPVSVASRIMKVSVQETISEGAAADLTMKLVISEDYT